MSLVLTQMGPTLQDSYLDMLKPRHIAIAVAIFCVFQGSLSAQNEGDREDLANFARYREENATLLSKIAKGEAKKPKAVLFGDSISDAWPAVRPSFFKDNNLIGRGSSGQTASRILLRMQRDVVDFHPKYVVILAGMNDVAQNGGYADQKNVIGYIASMCQIAKANRIRPIVGTLPPADHFFWKEDIGVHIEGANEKIRALNYAIRAWRRQTGFLLSTTRKFSPAPTE